MQKASRLTRYHLTFAVVLVSVTAWAMASSLILPVLATIQHALHTSQSSATWVLTSYLMSASIATPILGRVGDMWGKKRVLVAVLITLAVGCLLGAIADSIGVMILARVIQGVGSAALPLSFGIIREQGPPEKVGAGISFVAAIVAVGTGAGIVLAGPIVDAFNVHWLFWIPAGIVAVAALAAILVVPESTSRTRSHIPIAPALLLSGWLVALILAVSEAQRWGWTSGRILGLFAAAIVLGGAWVGVELHTPQPLIDMRMMRLPVVWTTNLVALLFGAAMYANIGFLPQFLQTPRDTGYGFGASVTTSGLYLLPMTVTMFIFGMLSAPVAARIGSKLVLFIGSLTMIAPFAILAFAHSQQWEIYLSSVLLGVGLGFGYAAMSNLIVEAVPANQVGVASGMNANIRTIGGSIGGALMAIIVTSGAAADGLPRATGYRDGFGFLMIISVGAMLACLLIPRARRSELTMLAEHPAIEHGETAIVAGATLVEID